MTFDDLMFEHPRPFLVPTPGSKGLSWAWPTVALCICQITLPFSFHLRLFHTVIRVGRSARRSCPTSLGFSRFKSSSCFADQELYFHCHLLKAFPHAERFPGAEQILSLWKTSRGPRHRREPHRVTCVYLLPLGWRRGRTLTQGPALCLVVHKFFSGNLIILPLTSHKEKALLSKKESFL